MARGSASTSKGKPDLPGRRVGAWTPRWCLDAALVPGRRVGARTPCWYPDAVLVPGRRVSAWAPCWWKSGPLRAAFEVQNQGGLQPLGSVACDLFSREALRAAQFRQQRLSALERDPVDAVQNNHIDWN